MAMARQPMAWLTAQLSQGHTAFAVWRSPWPAKKLVPGEKSTVSLPCSAVPP